MKAPDHSTSLIFEEPPSTNVGGSTRWEVLLSPLRERPMEWARVATFRTEPAARSAASQLRNGSRGRRLDPTEWEFVAGVSDGEPHIWARFVGPSNTNEKD